MLFQMCSQGDVFWRPLCFQVPASGGSIPSRFDWLARLLSMRDRPCSRAGALRCDRGGGFDTGLSWHAEEHTRGLRGSGDAHRPSTLPVRCPRVFWQKLDRPRRRRIAARHRSSPERCFPNTLRYAWSPSERLYRVQAHGLSTSSLVWFFRSRARHARTLALSARPQRLLIIDDMGLNNLPLKSCS